MTDRAAWTQKNGRKLQDMELDREIKLRTPRKLDLETQKLEKEVITSVEHCNHDSLTQCVNHCYFLFLPSSELTSDDSKIKKQFKKMLWCSLCV